MPRRTNGPSALSCILCWLHGQISLTPLQHLVTMLRTLALTTSTPSTAFFATCGQLLTTSWSWAAMPPASPHSSVMPTLTGPVMLMTASQHLVTSSPWEAAPSAGAPRSSPLSLSELGQDMSSPTTLHVDNQSAIAIAQNPEFHDRMKHIDVYYHYIRQVVNDGTVCLVYTPT